MSSRRVVDLRKKRPGADIRALFSAPERPKRRSTLRTKRRRNKILTALVACFVLAVGGFGVSYASYAPQLSLKDVRVEGAHTLSADAIQKSVEETLYGGARSFFSRSNMFLYPRSSIESALRETYPRIEDVEVKRESLLATVLTVTLVERSTYARWCNEVQCFDMDADGFVFSPVDTARAKVANAVSFYGGVSNPGAPVGHKFVAGSFPSVRALLERLGQAGFIAERVVVQDTKDFYVYLSSGYMLKVSFGRNADSMIDNLKLVLSSEVLRGKEDELEYIDLRFGNRVYYKLKGEIERGA